MRTRSRICESQTCYKRLTRSIARRLEAQGLSSLGLSSKKKCTPLTERIQQTPPVPPLVCCDLATCTSHLGLLVEGLPEVIEGFGTWSSSDVEQNADLWLRDQVQSLESSQVLTRPYSTYIKRLRKCVKELMARRISECLQEQSKRLTQR